MINNDVLRRLRYALRLSNDKILAILRLSNYEIPLEHLLNIMKKEDEEGFIPCRDSVLALFLDGLIIDRRGKQERKVDNDTDKPSAVLPARALTNNEILRKIRIALELQDKDIIEVMDLAGFRVSKPELSALFRRADHRNYKECGDQFLRNFLVGLTLRYREGKDPETK